MRTCRAALLALALLGGGGARAGEQFPGQLDLAAGLVCFQNLDLECARARLERALQAFSPERDPDYLQHLQAARLKLAELYTAQDDLARAEEEFVEILLVCPGYALPPGDHPPKLLYVLEQARAKAAAAAPLPGEGKVHEEPAAERPPLGEPAPAPVEPAEPAPRPAPEPAPPGPAPAPAALPAEEARDLRLALSGGVVALFGEDAEEVSSGPGVGLRFAWRPAGPLALEISYAYAYHPTRSGDGALQSMALALGADLQLPAGPLAVRLGLALGAHAMGTRDRYDHWLALLQGRLALLWPVGGSWGLGLEVAPSLVINADESSFFLPLSLLAEVRW